LLSGRDTTSSTRMGAEEIGNNQREWEGNGKKARLTMELRLGMAMDRREWEGMGWKRHSRSSLTGSEKCRYGPIVGKHCCLGCSVGSFVARDVYVTISEMDSILRLWYFCTRYSSILNPLRASKLDVIQKDLSYEGWDTLQDGKQERLQFGSETEPFHWSAYRSEHQLSWRTVLADFLSWSFEPSLETKSITRETSNVVEGPTALQRNVLIEKVWWWWWWCADL